MTSTARTKMFAATFGAGVVLTMGALTVAAANTEAHATSPTINGAGVTSVQTTAPASPAVPVAAPKVIAKKFAGKDWQGQ